MVAERKRLAKLVGNVGSDLVSGPCNSIRLGCNLCRQYPIFEAALTGRAAMQGAWADGGGTRYTRAGSIIDIDTSESADIERVRHAFTNSEGLVVSVFTVLRLVPRRIIMVLKLNDLTRGLDRALRTTHSNVRFFIFLRELSSLTTLPSDSSFPCPCKVLPEGIMGS